MGPPRGPFSYEKELTWACTGSQMRFKLRWARLGLSRPSVKRGLVWTSSLLSVTQNKEWSIRSLQSRFTYVLDQLLLRCFTLTTEAAI